MIKKIITTAVCAVLAGSCVTTAFAEENLPESYDLRSEGAVSSVKNQHPFGTCWAFAGIASAETALIRNGLADSSIDLSEEALMWNACGNWLEEGAGWANKSKNDGGFPSMVQGILASKGAYLESDVPYVTDNETEYYISENAPKSLKTVKPVYRVTDIVYVNTDDRDEIKQTIKDYGAVSTVWYDSGEYRDDVSAYWNSEGDITNHQIAVVGWDDNYSKDNFLESNGSKPQNDGAWLIKNSYGDDFGDNGYMWISYEDATIFMQDNEYFENHTYAFKSFEKLDDSSKILQYDDFGAVSSIKDTGSIWANVYDFSEGKNYINEITFQSPDAKGQTCKIYYAPVDGNNKPVTDKSKMTLLAEKNVEYNGYTTVKLENSVVVPKEKGAIVIEFDRGASVGTSEVLMYAGRGKFIPERLLSGVSFQIKDGKIYDLGNSEHSQNISHEACNISLKAVTSDNPVGTPLEIAKTQETTVQPTTKVTVPDTTASAVENTTVKATADEPNKNDNNAVPTGVQIPTIAVIALTISLAAVLVLRRKFR